MAVPTTLGAFVYILSAEGIRPAGELDMKDEVKTKDQLLAELHELRRRVAGLEKDKGELERANESLQKSEEKLRLIAAHLSDPEAIAEQLDAHDRRPIESATSQEVEVTVPGCQEMRRFLSAQFPVSDVGGEACAICSISTDTTDRKKMEEALKKSQAKLAEVERAAQLGSWEWDLARNAFEFSDNWFHIVGASERSMTHEDFLSIAHPDDRKATEKTLQDALSGVKSQDIEYRITRQNDGQVRYLHAWGNVTRDATGKPLKMYGFVQDVTEKRLAEKAMKQTQTRLKEAHRLAGIGLWDWVVDTGAVHWYSRIAGIAEDITARRELEDFLRIERDVAIKVASAQNLSQALEFLFEACLQAEGMDSGGVYLIEAETEELRLRHHRGLSPEFVVRTQSYGPGSPQARCVLQGEPRYWSGYTGLAGTDDLLEKEGIRSLVSIPLKAEDEVIGALNIASHSRTEIPLKVQELYESIAHKAAGIVAHIRMRDKLQVQTELLEEANAALRALLRQREEDRIELERTIIDNVRALILPYVDKLKNSRPSEHQRLYIELLESHLKEVVTPLLQRTKVTSVLTPSEIRVAELIRHGRTTKEIAEILRTSESTVHFHRKSIRRKLELNHKKTNLKSYLGNPEKW